MTTLPIILPDGFTPDVNVGDNIIIGQTIASKKSTGEEIVNIQQELSVSRSQVKKILKKSPGDSVSIGDILAQKKSFFGGVTTLRSKAEGTVVRYERDSGNLVIKTGSDSVISSLFSPVDGSVSLCNNKEIKIDTDKNVFIGIDSTGTNGEGKVLILRESDPYYLNSQCIDKIIVGQSFSREMLLKGIGIGVTGIIGTDISEKDLEYLNDKRFKAPVIKVDDKSLDKIIEWSGKKVFLDAEKRSIILFS